MRTGFRGVGFNVIKLFSAFINRFPHSRSTRPIGRPYNLAVMASRLTEESRATRRIDLIALAAVMIAALALRLFGLNWDRGYYLHPDELHVADVTTSRIKLTWPPDWGNLSNPEESTYNPRANNPD